ncbi:NrfD/PsrC family molybdoenzyme membrane anchor subunit [Spirabiliibacterium falconis]|uniref:NrfD/PsrC family molybdoenzyme membrane anchor subunit n=1 Tax=Spirabiliibacterium falconis TaxID=572023 RepID=UPI001F440680|nr:NrfD/PsrC family molybdoenzyme membrane anchor subunit [Spirabiliibacterium falconis]
MIREVLVEPQAIAWLPWAVSYFFFIGIAIAAILTALFARYVTKPYSASMELVAVTLALSCVIVAPIALTADLHQPGRVWHFYAYFAHWSWMAWGSIFLPLFSVAVVGYFFFLLRHIATERSVPKMLHFLVWGKTNNLRLSSIFAFFSLFSAVLILLYTTMEVYVVTSRPLWHQAGLVLFILLSAIPSAILLTAFFLHLYNQSQIPVVLRYIALMSIALWGICVFILSQIEVTGHHLSILWQHSPTTFYCLVSALLLVFSLSFANRTLWLDALSALFALIFTVLMRWVLLIEVQTLPKYSAMLNPYHFEWNTDGGLGMLSMLGLWLFVGIILWQLIRLLSPTRMEVNHYEQ